MAIRDMEKTIRYLRKQTASVLDRQTVAGLEVPANPEAGRHARCWVHGMDAGVIAETAGSMDAVGGVGAAKAADVAASVRPANAVNAAARRVVVELHGGGFAMGDARKGDALREWMAKSFDAVAVGLDYRLAPEHPAPAALEDVLATIAFVSRRFSAPDGAPPQIYLLGFSAGANLALAAALQAQGDARRDLAGLALHYPLVDASEAPSKTGGPAGLAPELMSAFSTWYTADVPATDVRVSPALADDESLCALPRIVIYPVMGDPLFAQAERFARRLEALGRPVSLHPVEGMFHGFIEDVENVDLYRELTAPQTIEARPADFAERAAGVLKASLEELMGPVRHNVPFPGLEVGETRTSD